MKTKLVFGFVLSLFLVGCGQSSTQTTQTQATAPSYVMTANGRMLDLTCLRSLPAGSLQENPALAAQCKVAESTNQVSEAAVTSAYYYYPPNYWGSNYASPYTASTYGNYNNYTYGSYLCSALLGSAWGYSSNYSCYQSIFGYNNSYVNNYNAGCSSSCLYSWNASCGAYAYGYGTNTSCYSGYSPYSSAYGYGYSYAW